MRYAVEFTLVLAGVLALLALGGAAIAYGGADDSPGLQGVGLAVVVGTAAAALRWRGSRGRRAEGKWAESAGAKGTGAEGTEPR